MPSTLILGSPAGPDGLGGAFSNTVEADRSALWDALGGRQGVLRGFGYTAVAGQMALDIDAASSALVGERANDGTASLTRGYHVYTPEGTATRIVFDPASVSNRNDAVVAAFVDTEDGSLGTGVSTAGPQVVVVTGVSGVTVPRTDAEINAFIGRGGWVRLFDVPIASTDTEINVANIVTAKTTLGVETGLRQVVKFTASGSFAKADYPWLRAVRVKVQGGGGAGSGSNSTTGTSGSGGGGGGYAEKLIPVASLAASETVTIGAGGAGAGAAGAASSFGAHCSGNGGDGGSLRSTDGGQGVGGGAGGSGTGGDLNISGQSGRFAYGNTSSVAGSITAGGDGGSSQLGRGGAGAVLVAGGASAGGGGVGYGGGGGGGANDGGGTAAGGAGTAGIVIVELYG